MLAEAFGWWAARMAELVPESLLRRHGAGGDAVIVSADGNAGAAVAIALRRQGRERPLGVIATTDRKALRDCLEAHAKRAPILLRPPPGALLEKRITLPGAARRELRRVIGYQMTQVTPFEADEVFWACAVERHDAARDRLHVRLSLVPRDAVRPLLAALDEAGAAPAALEVAAADGAPRLMPLRQDSGTERWHGRATRTMAAVCAGLAAVAVALPFVLQSLALGAVEARIAALQPDVARVQALRQRIAAASAGRDTIGDERQKVGNPLEILAAVTELLPDDTYLTELTLRQRRLTIGGQSAAAPKLIAGFAADPMFRNPGFAAPVTRNEAMRRDIFSMRAEVAP